MTLEKVAKIITKQFGIANKKEGSQGVNPIPYQIQSQFQQQYSAMVEQVNKVQQANLLVMEKRLGNRIDQMNMQIEDAMKDRKEREKRIEKRLGQRDENLMKVIREIQEVKSTIVSAKEEIAAAKLKKKSWWKFRS